MGIAKHRLYFLVLIIITLSCNSDKKANYPNFVKAILYSIDSNFYSSSENPFADSTLEYAYILNGSSFVDTTGKPIHDKYDLFNISNSYLAKLKSAYLFKDCSNVSTTCDRTYRDVIVLFNSNNKVAGLAQIRFDCTDISVYPQSAFKCGDVNFTSLKKILDSIKRQ